MSGGGGLQHAANRGRGRGAAGEASHGPGIARTAWCASPAASRSPRPACHAAAKIKAHELRGKGKEELLAQVRPGGGGGGRAGGQGSQKRRRCSGGGRCAAAFAGSPWRSCCADGMLARVGGTQLQQQALQAGVREQRQPGLLAAPPAPLTLAALPLPPASALPAAQGPQAGAERPARGQGHRRRTQQAL